MKGIAYYRISTKEQDLAMQQKAVRDYCEREGITLVKEFEDIGQSGKKESRPEFDKLLIAMRNKECECIVVYKLDRIGRSLNHLLKLFEEFEKKNIEFISVTQSFNTQTPEGKLMLRMMMILAEYEREMIVARIYDGLASSEKTPGRPKGKKDSKPRKKSGYYQRWANK